MPETNAPIAYTIPGAVQASGITRSRLYELIGQGVLDARKVGRRTAIMAESLNAYVRNLPRAEIRAPHKRAA